ncbi:hypothetical protein HZH68_003307 [Vespula germanica]|uniref:Uncharacterized protein n=1 Tax=Vespula germanica TaxID=30212 RepID=A0A834NNY2_VESGE|nr:hypothetical protein HZH68_003307 [Vespula germanica]
MDAECEKTYKNKVSKQKTISYICAFPFEQRPRQTVCYHPTKDDYDDDNDDDDDEDEDEDDTTIQRKQP